MALSTLLTNDGLIINIVIQIGDDYFADKTPDSDPGSLINQTVGLLGNVTLPAPYVDVLRGDVTISSVNFELVDAFDETDEVWDISNWYGLNNNAMYGVDVTIWAGASGQSQAFPADYTSLATAKMKRVSKNENVWKFEAVDVLDRLNVAAFNQKTFLASDATDADATLTVDSTSDFPTSGYIKINSEVVAYSGKSATTFTGCTRASLGSEASEHDTDDEITLVQALTGNALELALQLMTSEGGGGSYDLLDDGAGVDEDLVDVDAFEELVDDFEDYPMTIYISDVDSVLNLISQQILLPYGLRLISKQGQIGIAQIDIFDASVSFLTIDEEYIGGTPTLKVDSDEVINSIRFKWDYSFGAGTFSQNTTYTDSESVTKYGARETHEFEFKSSIDNGATLFSSTKNKLFARYAQPLATIEAEVDRVGFLSNPGDDIRVIHKYLPQMGTGLGHDAFMELMGVTRRQNGFCKFTLQYASYSNFRMGLIAPSPLIASITSQSVFAVESGEGKFYREGFALRLWQGTAYLADTVRTITDVTGDTITVTPAWATTLATDMRVKFADYDDCSDLQRVMYAFIAGNAEGPGVVAADSSGDDQDVQAADASSVDQDVVAYAVDVADTFSDGKPPFQIVP